MCLLDKHEEGMGERRVRPPGSSLRLVGIIRCCRLQSPCTSPTPPHLQHLGVVTLHSIMKGRLPVVVRDVHLGVAVLHQLHQDLPVTLAAGQVQGGAALLILPVIGAAVAVGVGWAQGGRGAEKLRGSRGKRARGSRAFLPCSGWLVRTEGWLTMYVGLK